MTLVVNDKATPEGKDILEQLRQLCPEGDFQLGADGVVKPKKADFCKEATDEKKVKHPAGCSCICQLISSENRWTITGVKMTEDHIKNKQHWPHTTPTDETKGVSKADGKAGDPVGGSIEAPTSDSEVAFDAYDPEGHSADIPYHKVLGHELCGHAKHLDHGTHDPRPQRRGDRPGHNQAIDEENVLRIEQGKTIVRGRYNNPEQGESTSHKRK